MRTTNKFTVVKDGIGWNVADADGILVGDPMTKAEAIALARDCNTDAPRYVDVMDDLDNR